ncbi:related to phosducin homolog, likely to be involved in regulation of pheromone response [Serendipita indica DSM 11827]|uniref:Related to phosducin homolog, likely to be involved in regulation of pheromone response n=1 Tax=Serendipita indica (strain DSM 11827) TaxID=1109443 RepID=G4U2G9_SERID|nr:related to phosducin homolog, likely to be involved in regulation of pheromone response [Serendipita indica DSM 11827]
MDPNEDTEFNDALRKYGILPAKKERTPTPSPPPSPSLVAKLDEKTTDEIDELLQDGNDSETERIMLAYREKRLKEMKKEQKLHRFGDLLPISRDDYTREVADASKVDEPGKEPGSGTGVVCFLYKEGVHPPSVRLTAQLRDLASRYPRTKFTAIVGNKCIPNYPDSMLPTLILYRGGTIKEQLVAWGAKTEGSIQELEAVLIHHGILDPTQFTQRPKSPTDEDDEEESDKPTSKIRSSAKKGDDSDSDFDL